MKAYQYTADGYYLGECEDFGFLPNNATHTAPEEKEGFISHWNGAAWEQVENHKDEQGYLDGQPYTIKEYGPYPVGWSATPPEPTEDEQLQQEVERIKARLREIDSESSRPLRAIAAGSATVEDTAKLAALDAEAVALRTELAEMGGEEA